LGWAASATVGGFGGLDVGDRLQRSPARSVGGGEAGLGGDHRIEALDRLDVALQPVQHEPERVVEPRIGRRERMALLQQRQRVLVARVLLQPARGEVEQHGMLEARGQGRFGQPLRLRDVAALQRRLHGHQLGAVGLRRARWRAVGEADLSGAVFRHAFACLRCARNLAARARKKKGGGLLRRPIPLALRRRLRSRR